MFMRKDIHLSFKETWLKQSDGISKLLVKVWLPLLCPLELVAPSLDV
jgi:hypothetical protein